MNTSSAILGNSAVQHVSNFLINKIIAVSRKIVGTCPSGKFIIAERLGRRKLPTDFLREPRLQTCEHDIGRFPVFTSVAVCPFYSVPLIRRSQLVPSSSAALPRTFGCASWETFRTCLPRRFFARMIAIAYIYKFARICHGHYSRC